jgi:predicted RNase H-like nuclease (RuvC/YqgF family)
MSAAAEVRSVSLQTPITIPAEAPGPALSPEALEEVRRLVAEQLAPLKEVQNARARYGDQERNRITRLEGRITGLENQITGLENRVTQLESNIEKNVIAIQALQAQIAQLNTSQRQSTGIIRMSYTAPGQI